MNRLDKALNATAIYSFYSKTLYIKNKSKIINLFYTKFIPKIERSLTFITQFKIDYSIKDIEYVSSKNNLKTIRIMNYSKTRWIQ